MGVAPTQLPPPRLPAILLPQDHNPSWRADTFASFASCCLKITHSSHARLRWGCTGC